MLFSTSMSCQNVSIHCKQNIFFSFSGSEYEEGESEETDDDSGKNRFVQSAGDNE